MLFELKKQLNTAFTENGAVTKATSGSDCLDFFAAAGALRNADELDIIIRFAKAYSEDKDLAMRILFYARDVRGGLGERRLFRVILKWLACNHCESLAKNLHLIAEYGRFDDYLVLLDTPADTLVLRYLKKLFYADIDALSRGESVSLLAKWLPSINASSGETVKLARRIAKYFGMSFAHYRRALVALRKKIAIIENNLRETDYTFDYEKVPSCAMFKYRRAFIRNDGDRYSDYLSMVRDGTAKMHTGALAPYEIIRPLFERPSFFDSTAGVLTDEEKEAIDTTWRALEDFTGDENSLAVIDGSGSMYRGTNPDPICVAMSLGIYFAERNRGHFKNHFITFSESPSLVEIKGSDIAEKVDYCKSFGEVANTNIQSVFELILFTAVINKLPQSEMPDKIYIISDMEFDRCTVDSSLTNFEYAKKIFAEAGYRLPEVVFWNVASRNEQQPVTMNEQGVALVSGCTPRLFSMLSAGVTSPYGFMLDVLSSDRYSAITA